MRFISTWVHICSHCDSLPLGAGPCIKGDDRLASQRQVSDNPVRLCPASPVSPAEPTAMSAPVARVAQRRAAAEGLGSHQKAMKYLGQDFESLRRQCLDSGVLFKDPEFPACPSALGYKDLGPHSPQTQGVVWKRPTVSSQACSWVSDGTEGCRFFRQIAEGEVIL